MAPNRMFQQLTDKTKKKKKHRPFYEAVDAHARRRLKIFRFIALTTFHTSLDIFLLVVS